MRGGPCTDRQRQPRAVRVERAERRLIDYHAEHGHLPGWYDEALWMNVTELYVANVPATTAARGMDDVGPSLMGRMYRFLDGTDWEMAR